MENKDEQLEQYEPFSTELQQSSEKELFSKSSSNSDSNSNKNSNENSLEPHLEIVFLTLFPESIQSALDSSLLGRAQKKNKVQYRFIQIRDFSQDKHKSVDDSPYGGGEGMILRADVLYEAYCSIKKKQRSLTVLLSPQGKRLDQSMAKKFTQFDQLIVICGHYEGLDERFIKKCVDLELSIGDYILTGGESAAIVLADCVTRLIPGVVGKEANILEESLEKGLLKYPQYTRPYEFEGMKVPEVLISGDHQKIKSWRDHARVETTLKKRPDLFSAWESAQSE